MTDKFRRTIDNLELLVKDAEAKAPPGNKPKPVPPGEAVTRHDLIGKTVEISEEKAQGMKNLILLKEARKAGVRGLSMYLFKFPEKMSVAQKAYIEKAMAERIEKREKALKNKEAKQKAKDGNTK